MADIRHRVGISTPQGRVFAALATPSGLATRWTRTLGGDPHPGGRLSIYFCGAAPGAVMEVVEEVASERIVRRCVDGVAQWVGTALTSTLRTSGDETVLMFTHADWREPVEFMHNCGTKSAYFLLGLKRRLEGGPSTLYPDDAPISEWG